jgi:hypothetical protein
LVDQLLAQTYDMVIIGWTGLGSDPNDDAFWRSVSTRRAAVSTS